MAKRIFARIPFSIISATEYDYRRVEFYCMICFQMPLTGILRTSNQLMCRACEFAANRHYTKQWYNDLLELCEKSKLIKIDWTGSNNSVEINKLESMDCNGVRFANICYDEIMKIRSIDYGASKKNVVNHSHVVLVLSYIRYNMTYIEKHFMHGCYMHINNLSESIGLSPSLVKKCIEYLEYAEILITRKLNNFKYNNLWITGFMCFANAKDIYNDCNYGEIELNKILKYVKTHYKS